MNTKKYKVIVLSRSLGEGGAGISALDYLLSLNKAGFETLAIYQSGYIPVDYTGQQIKLSSFNLIAKLEKSIFDKYPTNPSRELISTGLGIENQYKIIKQIRVFARDSDKTLVYAHWTNLGFVSLKTLAKLCNEKNLKLALHIHDLWYFQDLFHTPSSYKLGNNRKILTWSLEGRPNFFQKSLLRRSRRIKKKIINHAHLVFPTESLKNYVKINFFDKKSSSISDSRIHILSQSLYTLARSYSSIIDSKDTARGSKPNFLIPGGHNIDDARMNYKLALNSFLKSEVRNLINLKVISGTPLATNIIKNYLHLGITFKSSSTHQAFLYELASADAIICPSLFEAFGLTIAESLNLSRIVGIQSETQHVQYFEKNASNIFVGDWSKSETWEKFYQEYLRFSNSRTDENKSATNSIIKSREEIEKEINNLFEEILN